MDLFWTSESNDAKSLSAAHVNNVAMKLIPKLSAQEIKSFTVEFIGLVEEKGNSLVVAGLNSVPDLKTISAVMAVAISFTFTFSFLDIYERLLQFSDKYTYPLDKIFFKSVARAAGRCKNFDYCLGLLETSFSYIGGERNYHQLQVRQSRLPAAL